MDGLTITYAESGHRGRYAAHHPDVQSEGELTFTRVSPTLIIADHTVVPDSMRGMGVAKALTERLIADSRAAGQKIVPLCPFVKSYAERHRDTVGDVIQW